MFFIIILDSRPSRIVIRDYVTEIVLTISLIRPVLIDILRRLA